MRPAEFAMVRVIANRFDTPDRALNRCSIGVQQLIDELVGLDVGSDAEHIEVSAFRGEKEHHPALPPKHSLLRIGVEYVDVTRRQIDVNSPTPWHVYPDIDAVRAEWGTVASWATGEAY